MALQTSQIVILVLMVLMGHSVMVRSRYAPWMSRQELSPYLLEEVGESDERYEEAKKPTEVDVDYNSRWSWLKDMLLNGNGDSRVVRKNIPREHVQKKSNSWGEYMTPCHFKICNFGRKRNVFNL